jgi:hydrogenase expression/formation protein HypD
VFENGDGEWRGIARVGGGDLKLRSAFSRHDATVRFADELSEAAPVTPRADLALCRCGAIMTGRETPAECSLFGRACRPDAPVGACMVSSEGICRIWFENGQLPASARP